MKYPGPWRAIVAENSDPLKLCRVKLEVPDVMGELVSDWASPMTLFTGSRRDLGLFVVPEVGNRVWAFFEDCDPDKPVYAGSWPARPGASDTADLAQGTKDATRAVKGTDVTVAALGTTKTEPSDSYEASYPDNKVWKTASGHLIELDDTPGAERVHILHRSGSSIEIRPNGEAVIRTHNEQYELVQGDRTVHVIGTQITAVEGTESKRIGFAEEREIGGPQDLLVSGSRNALFSSNYTQTIAANKTETVGGLRNATVAGADSLQATSSNVIIAALQSISALIRQEQFGTRNTVIAGADIQTIGLGKTVNVGAAFSLSSAGVLTLTASQIILNSALPILDNQPSPWRRS